MMLLSVLLTVCNSDVVKRHRTNLATNAVTKTTTKPSSMVITLSYPLIAMMLISFLSGIVIQEKQFVYAADGNGNASNTIAKKDTTTLSGSPATPSSSSSSSLHGFSFAAAGDWACNSNTINTVKDIQKRNPNLVLGLGDYWYSDYLNETRSPDCWFKIVKPIESKIKIAIGNHEHDSQSLLNLYMNRFNLTKQYYSFNYHHFERH
jgi:hypothetical protein